MFKQYPIVLVAINCLLYLCGTVAQAQSDSADTALFTTRPNPKSLALPDSAPTFQFAIYGDRTGGVPAGLKVLDQAVKDTNLLGPDLVMTVGDLVQGYNRTEKWLEQKDEYKAIMDRLKCRWFPVAGNHDVYWDQGDKNAPLGQHEGNYEKHFGPLWYCFQHKNSGFLVLYSDEGDPETNQKGFREGRLQTMSHEQLDFLQQALDELESCDNVFVFLHHPRWIGGGYEGGNWEVVHQKLKQAGNVSAVFAGHIHHMRYDGRRDGIEYFALATTGGSLSDDFPAAGYLHHYNLVTVRGDRIDVATIPVGTVVDPRIFGQEYLTELAQVRQMRPSVVGSRLPLNLAGHVLGTYSVSIANPSQKYPLELQVVPQLPDRWAAFPQHRSLNLAAGESAEVAFKFLRDTSDQLVADDPMGPKFDVPQLQLQTDLLLDDVRVHIPVIQHQVELRLSEPVPMASNACLTLANVGASVPQGVRIDDSQFELPQGPFTLEAWVNPSNNSRSRGLVAKTQSSEYALFSHDGRASFDVHLDGKYATARAAEALPLDTWTHVAGVYDGESVALYLDGKLVDRQPASGVRTQNRLPLYIGADPASNGAATRSFAGKIDEVRLSTGARYAEPFEPLPILKSDAETVLLFHLDTRVGPFFNDDGQGLLCRPVGTVETVERN